MNINELYANIPEDQHGTIAVSADAVTITQGKKSAVVLLKKTIDANAELTDSDGKAADRAHLEKNMILKPVADLIE
jgi:hypothetical protein